MFDIAGVERRAHADGSCGDQEIKVCYCFSGDLCSARYRNVCFCHRTIDGYDCETWVLNKGLHELLSLFTGLVGALHELDPRDDRDGASAGMEECSQFRCDWILGM